MCSFSLQATQVESRLPATRHRRSLLQAPKPVPNSIKSPELKPRKVSPTTSGSGNPQKTSVLHSKHLLIGQRVWTADGRVGTLQFKGKTHFSQGCLCGIRLDEPLGKNDGSVDGIQYFKCNPNHGIFIHAFKVQAVNSAGEVKSLELAPNTGEKIAPPQQVTGKETKQSSKIPALGISGRIARPKSLAVNDDKTPGKPPVGKQGLTRRTEISRIECFSAEKASNGSKLFQKKRISPADSGITVPGWTNDRTPPSRLPSIHSKSPLAGSHDATFTLAYDQSHPGYRNQNTHKSPPSRKKTPEQSSPRSRKSSWGSLKKELTSRPSLNDLTQLLQDDTTNEGDSPKQRKDGSRQKGNLNETFEVGTKQRGISPTVAEKKHPKDSISSPATPRDLNLTFDIQGGKKATPLSWDTRDKVTSTPLSSTENTYFWESDGISQSDIKAAFDVPDSEFPEGDDIEYNEFWAVPSALDTPTGRLRFDLLTPEEFEQALKDCNIPLDSPQSELPPLLEDSDAGPKLTDHCKPKVLESLTVVEDDLLAGSDTTFDVIPSFLVPAWSMDLDTTSLETSQSGVDPAAESDIHVPEEAANSIQSAVRKWSPQDNSDITNNNTERVFDKADSRVNQTESEISPKGNDRTTCIDTSAMNESESSACCPDPNKKPASTTQALVPDRHSASESAHKEDTTVAREDDQCVFTDDLSNEWQNLVQQAETDLAAANSDVNPGTLEENSSSANGSRGESDLPANLPSSDDFCHAISLQQQMATVSVKAIEENRMETQVELSLENGEMNVESIKGRGRLKAVSPTVTLNILSTGYDNVASPEKEKSFASEGSSESASTVIAEVSPECEQNNQLTIKERCPSAELETVTQCEMAEMTSPSYDKKKFGPELLNSSPPQQVEKDLQSESQKGKENGDISKLPRKRISYLQQPKSFSSSNGESSSKSNVAATKLKLTAAQSLDSKTETSTQALLLGDSKTKKGYKPGPWKTNSKHATSAPSKGHSSTSNVIPKQKTTETCTIKESKATIKLVSVKSKIDTGRKSLDMTGNKPSFTLPNKKASCQNSTSSLEVEPNSLSSSNRSMKSDLSGFGTRASSRSSSVGEFAIILCLFII